MQAIDTEVCTGGVELPRPLRRTPRYQPFGLRLPRITENLATREVHRSSW